jgi:HK97 gp10 family phage protein
LKTTVTGLKEILGALNDLPKELSDTKLQKVHAKAAEPLVNKIHRLAPVGLTGNLADSIGIEKPGKKNKGELGAIYVGPRRKGGFKGFAGHLNEYGTKPRKTKRGKKLGVMKAKPFEAPAWEQTQDEVEHRIADLLGDDVYRFLRGRVK